LSNVYQNDFNVKKIKEAMGAGMKIGKMCVCVKMCEGKEQNKGMKHIKGGNIDVDDGQRYSLHGNSAKKSQPNDGMGSQGEVT
jgi:hypothetical protein